MEPSREVAVRRFTIEALPLFRDVRLRALEDAPDAFGSTLAREIARTDDEWAERARKIVEESVLALAITDGQAVGMAGGYRVPHRPDLADLWGMWVDPSYRGTDVARRLVGEVAEWASEIKADAIELWVVETNLRAVRFYERLGFVDTGERQPMPRDPTLIEQRMEYPLTRSGSAPS